MGNQGKKINVAEKLGGKERSGANPTKSKIGTFYCFILRGLEIL